MNRTTSPEDYNDIKLNVGPFIVPSASFTISASDGYQFGGRPDISIGFGKILSMTDDHKENTRLVKGLVKLKSSFMGNVLDLETGKITSLVIPVLTKAHIEDPAHHMSRIKSRTPTIVSRRSHLVTE